MSHPSPSPTIVTNPSPALECHSAREKLLRQGWAAPAAVENCNIALDFGTAYAKKEPKKEDVQKFLGIFPSPLREAWGLREKDKFQKQKPAGWKSYCSAAYALAWQVFKAHVEGSIQE